MGETNCLTVLGPTASGKTSLAVRLAEHLNGVILSVDSRQVYRGLDIGSGKDLSEYVGQAGRPIPYRLIDIVDLDQEYSVFDFQTDFYRVFEETLRERRLPIAVGGTGLYLEAVLEGYEMVKVSCDRALREQLESLSTEELESRLREAKGSLHNTTDLSSRERMIRAIEIAEAEGEPMVQRAPAICPFIFGVEWERSMLRQRIGDRLKQRLEMGLINEVRGLRKQGASWERLVSLGLEYRFVSEFLQDRIKTENDLFQKLHSAINQFAKRQMTWFRRMERKGILIHWIPEGDWKRAIELLEGIEWNLDLKNTS
ncbi:MAG: tRNA (adenosine(37)-N6)-dimethylallyltransferase MiaA [Candidatus Omnitrophica bacterium]|nr:tRNA (adenosine(37)-N6)-dimethylallyltransferase MiaA [Candidatus Omnitrophota bacterium]